MTFVYGRPVRQHEFLNRESELLTLFNRLRNRESTAIVGEPHIGKTSLLLQASDRTIQERFLSSDAKRLISVFIDLHSIDFEYTPNDFWKEALMPFQRTTNQGLSSLVKQVETEEYKNSALRRLFYEIANNDQVLVLFLDEFDTLLSRPKFTDPSFFAGIRTLSTTTGGLVVITSSRLSVAELNKRGQELIGNVSTSPFFNHFIEIKLGPFDDETIGQLLNRPPHIFSPQEIFFIRCVAGRNPFLLQAMAATLVETPRREDWQAKAAEDFYKRINFHFDDLWSFMDDKVRTTAVILSLVDLEGYSSGNSFSYGEIENVRAFDVELRKLADLGLAEKIIDGWSIDIKHGLVWRGEKWTTTAQAFTWWMRDVVISESRQLKGYDDWLCEKKYRMFLTEGQWNSLVSLVKNAPEFLTKGIGSLAKSLIQEVTGKK